MFFFFSNMYALYSSCFPSEQNPVSPGTGGNRHSPSLAEIAGSCLGLQTSENCFLLASSLTAACVAEDYHRQVQLATIETK